MTSSASARVNCRSMFDVSVLLVEWPKLQLRGRDFNRKRARRRTAHSLTVAGGFGFQITEQSLKRLLESVLVFPVGEIGDEILAHFLGQVLAAVGIEAFPCFNFIELHNSNR